MNNSAELLYLYVEKSNFNIKNEGINFSANYEVDFKTADERANLTINRKISENEPFFHEKIINISMLVGKNGVGKSSLLKLIGFGNENRTKFLPYSVYFVIYKVDESLFFIEGSNSLLKKIFNGESKISRNRYFFEMDEGKPMTSESYNNHDSFFESSYQANMPNLEWVEDSILKKEKKDYPIQKHSYPTADFKNLIEFITEHDRSSVTNVELLLKQKKRYSANLMILFSIYELTKEDLNDRFDKRNIEEDSFSQKLFTTEVNTALKKLNNEKYRNQEVSYNRAMQDKVYKDNKNYFLLRLLEKEVISLLNSLSVRDYKQFQDVFKKIIELRRNEVIEISRQTIEIKIDFLVQILRSFENDSKIKLKSHESIDSFVRYFKRSVKNEYIKSTNELTFNLKNNMEYNDSKELVANFSRFFDSKIKQLSDGQLVYFNTFSKIYSQLNTNPNTKSVPLLLILDEPDLNLHPEWSRKFIYDLINLIKDKNVKRRVQIIITSHSPFMLTDLPSDRVYKITEKGTISKVTTSFAANIYDLLLDSFFLESSIGEFAKSKLKEKSQEQSDLLNKIDDPFLKKLLEKGKLK